MNQETVSYLPITLEQRHSEAAGGGFIRNGKDPRGKGCGGEILPLERNNI